MQKDIFGVIDIGSNTIRLVLFRKKDWGFAEEQNLKISARLRSYMGEDQVMTDEGIEIMINSLQKFHEITRHHNIYEVDAVATAAVRQARNRDEIIERVNSETDYSIRILSEAEEAYYGYLSVIHTTNADNGYIVDMGGGSTEVTLIKDRKMAETHSFPFGALSLFNQFIKNDQPGKKELKEMEEYLKEQLNTIPWLTKRDLPLIGIGGSARNMALIHQYGNEYPLSGIHHYEVPVKDIEKVFSSLAGLSLSDRKKVDGLSKDRADTIIPAIYSIAQLAEHIAADTFIMCRKGLREGVFYSHLLQTNQFKPSGNPRLEGIQSLILKYGIDQEKTKVINRISSSIIEKLEVSGEITDSSLYKDLMELASCIFYLGEHLESESSSQHTFYILSNSSLEGMNHKDRVAFALLASFKSRSDFRKYIHPFSSWFTEEETSRLELLGSVLKLSYFLNTTNRDLIKDIVLEEKKEGLIFTFLCKKDPYFEEEKSKKHKKHLEKNLNKSLVLHFEN